MFLGQTYSTDGDVQGNHGHYDFWLVKLTASSSGVQEADGQSLSIFPNPAAGATQLQLPENIHPKELSITDVYGNETLHLAEFPPNGLLQLEQLAGGMYWVKVLDDLGNSYFGKLLKQ